jgi:hypothetical protein
VATSSVVRIMLVDVQLSGSPVVVDGLDDNFVLELICESEQQAREADRRRLRLAVHWAERHVVSDALDAAYWSDDDPRDFEETIGGAGTPLIGAGCVEPLAASLVVASRTAMQLMSDGLDLHYRLPQVNAGMEELRIAPWRARRIANLTHGLSAEAAAYVDAQLAPVADSCGVTRIERLVTEAAAMFDPAEQAEAEDEAKAAWGVRLDHYSGQTWAGTSKLEIIGDTPTLTRFYDLVGATAHDQLDPDQPADVQPSLDHRKVAALGMIADGVGATTRTKLYLHLDAADLPEPPVRMGKVEKLGPLTVTTIREWLGTSRFTLQPVLDLARADAVDQHDPPAWMRELVILRDRTCVHPNCNKPSRDCDLDHIDAYVEMDDGGPPGQTRPDNLAPLCRRHHRAKTHLGWSYQRNDDGSYTWTSPHGQRYTVDQRGIVTRH